MRSRGFAAALAVALLLGGCGVARETEVIRDKAGPQRGLGSGTADFAEADGREATSEPKQFVTNYLRAAAGVHDSAVSRVRRFLASGKADTWRPEPDPLVVRQLGEFSQTPQGGGNYVVSVLLQPVGRLTNQGAVEPLPPGDRKPISRKFHVGPGEDDQVGLFLRDPDEQNMLLLTSALAPPPGGGIASDDVLYRPHLLYFWDADFRALVPDLRYLPRTLPAQQRPTEVVRRLLGGPSSLLKPTVQALPAGTDLRGSVVLEGNKLVVDVNAKATSVPADSLMAQLRWALWDQHEGPITLLVEGQPRASDPSPTNFESANPATNLNPRAPSWFCVADGVVLSECKDPAQQEPPAILATTDNANVKTAAIARRMDAMYGALVVHRQGSLALLVGRAELGAPTTPYRSAGLTAKEMSRPVWLGTAGQRTAQGLVAAGGKLYLFDAGGLRGQVDGAPPGVTAVAAAPDARRIALVARGQVFVAALTTVRPNEIAVVDPRALVTSLGTVTGVAWSRPDRLVIAGSGALAELTVDGAVEERFPQVQETGQSAVTQLVAYPDNPANGSARGSVMIELEDGTSYDVPSSRLESIVKTGTPTPSPAPAVPPKPPLVTAPFYLE